MRTRFSTLHSAVIRAFVFVCTIILGTGSAALGDDNAPLKVATSIKPPYCTEQLNGSLDTLLADLMHRAERQFTVVRLPAERSLWMLNNGQTDADLPRIAGLEKQYENLIRVPEPVMQYRFTAFTVEGAPNIATWDDLRPFKVAFITGWKIFEKNLPPGTQHYKVNSNESLFAMLREGRVDVALHERYLGAEASLCAMKPAQASPHDLAVQDMYIYLHKNDRDLANTLARILKKMRKTNKRVSNAPSRTTRQQATQPDETHL
ncbi:transporter substrate-binding domain-containing protein [Desulfovibrio mangrovi]|uniref:substrate-binding periplasmic protein n=1 Tax=Desulfovibrio mangrovi TaxID=2976983 RepID=UPI0022482691|nr:transporter substrate-binding domain-containing protein [Desulfovibrio mangrovi]UZP66066.1 transporter substrate-binding domain-containing protein [Desulfovibrio mangrovi]